MQKQEERLGWKANKEQKTNLENKEKKKRGEWKCLTSFGCQAQICVRRGLSTVGLGRWKGISLVFRGVEGPDEWVLGLGSSLKGILPERKVEKY